MWWETEEKKDLQLRPERFGETTGKSNEHVYLMQMLFVDVMFGLNSDVMMLEVCYGDTHQLLWIYSQDCECSLKCNEGI